MTTAGPRTGGDGDRSPPKLHRDGDTAADSAAVDDATTNDVMHGDASGTDATDADDPILSVVVVTYDEAERIADCLESVFEACADVSSVEVLVVDSNSTDGTVDVATEYDVTVLEIPDDSLTTPSAGRYVGTRRARGEYVLYVDGDVVLRDDGWLPDALDRVRSDPTLGGVDGYLNEPGDDEARSVEYLHGVALYDGDAIAAVGGYHPFLAAWEDVDLGFELRLAGYELQRLPVVTGDHPHSSSPFEQLRRWRRGYYRAGGQVCRKALARPPLLARWLGHFADKFVALGWLLVGFVSLVLQPPFVLGWLSLTAVGGAAVCTRMGVANGLQRGLSYLLFPAGFVLGFRRLPPRDAFPMEVVETARQGADREVVAAGSD